MNPALKRVVQSMQNCRCAKCGNIVVETDDAWQCIDFECAFAVTKQQAKEAQSNESHNFDFEYNTLMSDAEIFERWRDHWREPI